jgi:ketosteroid isomerase-like protein
MTEADLIESAHAWDQAMVDNDAAAIGRFIADEWTIVGPDGSVNGKTGFLSLIASGDLTHDVMTSEDLTVRVYGETGIVVAKGISAGHFKGERFRESERASNVFVRRDERWQCVLTHLSKLAPASG